MKVLHLVGGLDPGHGGPPVVAVNSCIAAQRQGIHTTLVYGFDPARKDEIAPALARLGREGASTVGLPYSKILRGAARSWGVCPALPRWLLANRRRFDLVHCHGAWQASAALTLILVAPADQPCVLTAHESLTEFDIRQSSRQVSGLAKRTLRPLWLRGFDGVIVASAIEARDSAPPRSAGRARITIIPHPVFDERSGPAAPRGGPLRAGALRIGFLGRLHPKKNVGLLIRALPSLPAEVTLAVAGEGPEREALQALAQEVGVAPRIDWLGFIGENAKERFFADIDVLAMPSAYECFGVAAAEAMAAGVPVIVSSETGVAEIVARGEAGIVVAASVESLLAALVGAMASPDRLTTWSTQAIAAAQSCFSFAAHSAALRRCYERLLGERSI
jgi:glycosyltransferase involved in cell wall biosynthesis